MGKVKALLFDYEELGALMFELETTSEENKAEVEDAISVCRSNIIKTYGRISCNGASCSCFTCWYKREQEENSYPTHPPYGCEM